jgi:hypothetical protein
MPDTPRYTLWIDTRSGLETADHVLARGLSSVEAADLIRKYDGRSYVYDMVESDGFVAFKLVDTEKSKTMLEAKVERTGDAAFDRGRALEIIDRQTVRRHRMFWSHEVSTDQEFDQRLARIERRRAIQQLDQEIVSALVDRLLADGLPITCCVGGRHPVLERSLDRAAILELLFDLDAAVLLIHDSNETETSWIELAFDEQGIDVISDYSADLEHLVETVMVPYDPD